MGFLIRQCHLNASKPSTISVEPACHDIATAEVTSKRDSHGSCFRTSCHASSATCVLTSTNLTGVLIGATTEADKQAKAAQLHLLTQAEEACSYAQRQASASMVGSPMVAVLASLWAGFASLHKLVEAPMDRNNEVHLHCTPCCLRHTLCAASRLRWHGVACVLLALFTAMIPDASCTRQHYFCIS